MIGSSNRSTKKGYCRAVIVYLTKEHAYFTLDSFSERKARRGDEGGVVAEKERHEQEDGHEEEVGRLEKKRPNKTESGDPGELIQNKAGTEQESRGAAARNWESEKASLVPGGTSLFQVRDHLRGQLTELVGKVRRERGRVLRHWDTRALRGEESKDLVSQDRIGEGTD
ncbi:hypothetical protein NDU88_003964 [Pleurodeles waltl]|uniref:Uncharacterized protein n=1 Tax=Pleurodeles waltl TaxID=8319 RepID=A0AAV7NM81_PLEWA|nr:hypothetical protein NDU88_003964 [Pleurodeles waltl]